MVQAPNNTELSKIRSNLSKLWPDVAFERIGMAQQQIMMITRRALDESEGPSEVDFVDSQDVRAWGIAAFVSGMGPLFGYWIETGRLRVESGLQKVLLEHFEQNRRRIAKLEANLENVLLALNERDIVPTVLKGMFTAREYFPNVGSRPMSDIDILLRSKQLTTAHKVLRDLGFVAGPSDPKQPHTSVWYPRAGPCRVRSLEMEHPDNPWSFDIHSNIDKRYFRGNWARYGELPNTEVRPYTFGEANAMVLRQPLLTMHLAQHASRVIHRIRLIHLVELAFILRRDADHGSFDWTALSDRLLMMRTMRFAYPALELVARLDPGGVDESFRKHAAGRASRRSQRMVDQIWESGICMSDLSGQLNVGTWSKGPLEFAFDLLVTLARAAKLAMRG